MYDLFVSYSRKDKPFVEQLVRSLEMAERNIWVDFDDIPFASDWWEEICIGIESSQVIIFIMSPDSLASEVCGLEIQHILKHKKRLIPILYRDISSIEVPQALRHLHWINFTTADEFDPSIRNLLETIDTDLEKSRQHTRLLVRSLEWERKLYSPDLLLQGDELAEMVLLLNEPNITELQQKYILTSQRRQRRQQMLRRFWSGFAGGALGVGYYVFAAFRTENIFEPSRVSASLSTGQIFGLFIGLLAVLSEGLPLPFQFSRPVQVVIRISASLIIGTAAWMVFIYFFYDYTPDFDLCIWAGLGLATGFILRILFSVSGWLTAIVTSAASFVPLYVMSANFRNGNHDSTLLYFNEFDQIYTIGIPLVILIAAGANAPLIWAEWKTLRKRLRSPRGLITETA